MKGSTRGVRIFEVRSRFPVQSCIAPPLTRRPLKNPTTFTFVAGYFAKADKDMSNKVFHSHLQFGPKKSIKILDI